jgi:hypothetical protein
MKHKKCATFKPGFKSGAAYNECGSDTLQLTIHILNNRGPNFI